MNRIDADTPLAELVTNRPELAQLLGKLGLDFCCGGARSIAVACKEAALNLDEVLNELVSAAPNESPDDWSSLGPSELVDHLEAVHHAYLKETLPWLATLAAKVIGVHGDNHPELRQVGVTFAELQSDLGPHLMKEEQILFPMIRQLYSSEQSPAFHCGSLGNPISVMMSEHDRVGDLLVRLKDQTNGYVPPADACGSYRALYEGLAQLEADTHLHVHKENNVLFAAVVAKEAEHGLA